MKTKVVGLGAGGHAKVVLDILCRQADVEVIGLLDNSPARKGTTVAGIPVLGDDACMADLLQQGVRHVFIGVGGVGDNRPRQRVFENALKMGFEVVSAIHPSAIISPSATLGRGVVLMPRAVVNTEARLGDNVIVNTAAVVEHECVIGAHVHIAPGACMGGAVTIGEGAHIGLGAVLLPRVTIGARVIVGAGSVVLKDLPDLAVAAGVPAVVQRFLDA